MHRFTIIINSAVNLEKKLFSCQSKSSVEHLLKASWCERTVCWWREESERSMHAERRQCNIVLFNKLVPSCCSKHTLLRVHSHFIQEQIVIFTCCISLLCKSLTIISQRLLLKSYGEKKNITTWYFDQQRALMCSCLLLGSIKIINHSLLPHVMTHIDIWKTLSSALTACWM